MELRKKFLRDDWLKAGMEILTDESHFTLMLKNLCARMEVTKGSFYHHFSGWPEYVDALLDYIYYTYTLRIFLMAEGEPAARRVEIMNAEISKIPFKLAVNIRCWAHCNKSAHECQKKIDRERIARLQSWLLEMGVEKEEAETLARVKYMIFIGVEYYALQYPDFDPLTDGAKIIRLHNEAHEAYIGQKKSLFVH